MKEDQWLKSENPMVMLELIKEGSRLLRGAAAQYRVSDRKLRLYGLGLFLSFLAMKGGKTYASKIDYAWIDGKGPPPAKWNLTEMDPALFASRSVQCYTTHGKFEKYEFMVSAKDACDLLRDVVGNPFRPMKPVRKWSLGECKVCGNTPNDEGELEHGKGCYTQSEDGGGSEFADEIVEPWLTPQVVMLANDAYENRMGGGELDPVTLLALADALEEAGCVETDDTPILGMYVCEKCEAVSIVSPWEGIRCGSCGSEFCRKQRVRDLPHPMLAALRSPGKKFRGFWPIDTLLGKT